MTDHPEIREVAALRAEIAALELVAANRLARLIWFERRASRLEARLARVLRVAEYFVPRRWRAPPRDGRIRQVARGLVWSRKHAGGKR